MGIKASEYLSTTEVREAQRCSLRLVIFARAPVSILNNQPL